MFPVIASIAGFTISSFGLFLLLAFIAAFFVIWRIIRVYDIDQEKTVDLFLATIFGSIIFARIYFLLLHIPFPLSANYIFNIYHYPGMSFWGGLIGAGLVLAVIGKRMKFNIWQMADIAVIGLFIGLVFSSIGCLLGSCEYGNQSALPIAVSLVGVIGKRFPVQIIQAVLALGVFFYLWKAMLRFHSDGKIAGMGLLLLGLIKIALEPLRPAQLLLWGINISYVYSSLLAVIGFWLLYKKTRKSLKHDMAFSASLITHQNHRKQVLSNIRKWWYNLYVVTRLTAVRWKRTLLKLLHVKANPNQF